MSILTFPHHTAERVRDRLHLSGHSQRAALARPAAAAAPHRSLLDCIDAWFDGWTDDRAALERYLARAQDIADLENRMREALEPRPPLRF